eukprot:TRINITY_DN3209_c0_g1_i3.p2 TRINITY_DN3209_c0_g1~~TRINITY_DN3209_c0_g1_i3.p2  ORF type:complete len:155 (-),score=11.20 TRINITY_DN3209_c0_g1_i3:141-605(-)
MPVVTARAHACIPGGRQQLLVIAISNSGPAICTLVCMYYVMYKLGVWIGSAVLRSLWKRLEMRRCVVVWQREGVSWYGLWERPTRDGAECVYEQMLLYTASAVRAQQTPACVVGGQGCLSGVLGVVVLVVVVVVLDRPGSPRPMCELMVEFLLM